MALRLYVVPASHPSAAVEEALKLKGLDYRRIDLLPVFHKGFQRVVFGDGHVPGVRLDSGEKITGSRRIMQRLEELVPEPALYPADPARRAQVEDADRWGDDVLQAATRRIVWAALRRRPKLMGSYAEDSKLPIPLGLAMTSAGLVARIEVRINSASDEAARADLEALPGWLDHVDELIADDVIGGEQPNAADLQLASSVRLLMTLGDVAPLIAGRPAEALALRLFPRFPGAVPVGVLPAEWVPVPAG